jgi:putative endonuclease
MSDTLTIVAESISGNERSTKLLGSRGETIAAEYLIRNGYRPVMSNFTVPVGRNSRGAQVTGEIDIIALDGETLCFIEVKTRRSEEFTPVITAVDIRKQRQITRTARVYRRIFGLLDTAHRFDVVTVLMPADEKVTIELVKGFWDEGKFRKLLWQQQVRQNYI